MPNSGSTHSCCNCGAHDYMLTMCKVDNNQEHVDFKHWKKRMAISPEEVANMRGEFLRRQWIEYWQQEWWDKCSCILCSIIRVCMQEWAMDYVLKQKKCKWKEMWMEWYEYFKVLHQVYKYPWLVLKCLN